MYKKLFPYRFDLFFFSLVALLFGSLFPISESFYSTVIAPLFSMVNVIAGVVLLSKKKSQMWFLLFLLFCIIGLYVVKSSINFRNISLLDGLLMSTYFLFYIIVTLEVIIQVWDAKIIDKNVIYGLISGYLSLGLIGFFICITIEFAYPNSFSGMIGVNEHPNALTENLMYYSYITLLTVGYGDILPVTALAKKAAVFIGLLGQFYMVILTAIVVGKLINQKSNN